MSSAFPCPLCHSPDTAAYFRDNKRAYSQCNDCYLVFVQPDYLPDAQREKAEYDLHQNTLGDAGYQTFLSRLSDPLLARLSLPAEGLDFGCGPGPVLAEMLSNAGCQMALYDPFFFPDPSVLSRQYDFITCTEAIEHFHNPAIEWARFMQMLKPGGWLAIMTKRVLNVEKFANWHYKNDPTHVCFFSTATFDWLAQKSDLEAEYCTNDVVLMRKKHYTPAV